ncbi:MAG: chromosomal replication initiator protein DnaA [Chloroflexi bacterium]|nr:chromosomal replication initiator protein DnaA [Chloroflexota bacterium]
MNAEQVWQAVLGELQLQLTKSTFDTWVKNTHVLSYEDGTFVIGVHNAYAKDWLENRLLTTIKRTLIGIVGQTVEIKFVVHPRRSRKATPENILLKLEDQGEEIPGSPPHTARAKTQTSHTQRSFASTGLNPGLTFETFVVGNSNSLAHAAARAVAENPGKKYNPLFIYGGVGLGKTHLLQAIGNAALALTSAVLYVSSETFTNELINAIRTQSTEEFRAKYRNHVDILLIDDIQFIAGKESTQEEFFHTFNTLYQAGKQIVMSSDRPPRAIKPLEKRLQSRFEQGLIADIQPPDLETRIAILRSKAELQSVQVPPEVIDYIAGKFPSNVRELEGALNRVVANAVLTKAPLTVEMAAAALRGILTRTDSITVEQVLEAVCEHYGLDLHLLKSRQRSHAIALPRQVAMYLLKEELGCSFPQIGEILGGRDHTTVLYGCEKIQLSIEEDDQLRRDVVAIRERLYKERVPATH